MPKTSKLAQYKSRARAATKKAAEKQQHTIIAVLLSFGLGYAKQEGWKIPSVGGIHPAVLGGSLSLLLAYFVKDRQVKRIAEASADGLLSVGAYIAGKEGFKNVFGGYVGGWGEEMIEEEW